ncbi:prolipoprotein diacylglyceryl transferase [Vibrio sp. D431a]|uniref:prolipoprotein diacylglyceryl transferase n=1 Tax=Vibrio sp. D431a TaxID=2837388 RepID=UPI002553CCB5|nr:prolipoprotein diacylglyceryl transferase [Vibrio sp. D431a]MDK9790659.1 prolipoprotein diacylglyceryl transferase [Vibrio sp. D431a]
MLTWAIDPVAFTVFGLEIRWYGVIFSIALAAVYLSMHHKLSKLNYSENQIDILYFGGIIAIVIGARAFHLLAYEPSDLLRDPSLLFNFRKGGLASHGGIIALSLWITLYYVKYKVNIRELLDSLVYPVLLFSIFVRIGNFMNSEVYGVPTNETWGVIFERIDYIPRYPTQLIEAGLYLLLLLAMYTSDRGTLKKGMFFSCLVVSMSATRFIAELTKENSSEFTFEYLTIGGVLSIITLLIGVMMSIGFQKSKV